MSKEYRAGNLVYSFLMVALLLSSIVAGALTKNYDRTTCIRIACYFVVQLIFLTYLRNSRSVSRRTYSKVQIVLFLFCSYLLACSFQNLLFFFTLTFLNSVMVLLYLDARLCYFQTCVCVVSIYFVNYIGVIPTLRLTECCFCAVVQLIAMWCSSNLISSLEAQNKQMVDQQQSLDDLTRVVEAKCEEARAAARSKSDFLSGMSHEIRTPLNVILGLNEMILRESRDKTVLKYAANIESSSNMLLSLINDLLDFSKIESGKMEILPNAYQLNSLLNDLLNMILPKARSKALNFEIEVDPAIPNALYGDSVRIRQIVINLLTNAVKYTDAGTVTFSTEYRKRAEGKIDLIFKVTDTGMGIRTEDLDKIFDSFQRVDQKKTRHIEGTGLGLALTKQFVEMMEGSITVESVYAKGSVFTAVIPQEVRGAEAVGNFEEMFEKVLLERKDYAESFHAPRARILVVDDNEMNLVVTEQLLKQTLVQVKTAKSGVECLSMLRKESFHIILLDHMMPGLDGIDTLKRIRQNNLAPDVPVIALTANAVSGAREMYLEYGFQDYLSKPIIGKALEKVLLTWLPHDMIEKGDAMAYLKTLDGYLRQGRKNLGAAKKCQKEKNWQEYAALMGEIKDSASELGGRMLSEKAAEQEQYAQNEETEKINDGFDEVLELYRSMLADLQNYVILHTTRQKEPYEKSH